MLSFGEILGGVSDLAWKVAEGGCFGAACLVAAGLVELVRVLRSIEEDFDPPSTDGAEIIEEPCPLDKSRNVVPLEITGSMLDGAIE
jgi:hypothetical protein